MTTISASVIADSISHDGVRLVTMHLRYPRMIHSELMTHRVFSRNARSSRAVPVATMLKEVETDPVMPLFWGKNQKGMQASEECDESVFLTYERNGDIVQHELSREDAWLIARDQAVAMARAYADSNYHKQVVNRILEPYMHIDVLVSSTAWANFLALRDHKDAEPHIAVLARAVRSRLDESKPTLLEPGDWHLPYVRLDDLWLFNGKDIGISADDGMRRLSVARCARISYKPFDGNGSIEAEIKRHDDLVGAQPLHASPAEHQGTPDVIIGFDGDGDPIWEQPKLHGNITGWIQYRKTLKGENITKLMP